MKRTFKSLTAILLVAVLSFTLGIQVSAVDTEVKTVTLREVEAPSLPEITCYINTYYTDTITIEWTHTRDMKLYYVYCYDGDTLIKSDTVDTNTYKFTKLNPGTEYKFLVVAANIYGVRSVWTNDDWVYATAGKKGSTRTRKQGIYEPDLDYYVEQVFVGTNSDLNVYWQSVEGATSYTLFYKKGYSTNWQEALTTKNTAASFRDIYLANTIYTFKVRVNMPTGSIVTREKSYITKSLQMSASEFETYMNSLLSKDKYKSMFGETTISVSERYALDKYGRQTSDFKGYTITIVNEDIAKGTLGGVLLKKKQDRYGTTLYRAEAKDSFSGTRKKIALLAYFICSHAQDMIPYENISGSFYWKGNYSDRSCIVQAYNWEDSEIVYGRHELTWNNSVTSTYGYSHSRNWLTVDDVGYEFWLSLTSSDTNWASRQFGF